MPVMIDPSIYEKQLAIAVSFTKPAARFEITRRVVETGSFQPFAEHVSAAALGDARSICEQCAELGLSIVPLTSPHYPMLLRHIGDPPSVLYLRGAADAAISGDAYLAVVGRRAASVDTCLHATRLAQELADAGCTIVSGLALGIDAAAHRGALKSDLQCPTIAVLAHGLDRVYPPTHVGLAKQIVDMGGILVSEYPPGVSPMRHHFLARNRIIAGLSRGVVVVEAGARSGSLVTAQFAADFGRDVFVVQASAQEQQEGQEGGENLLAQGAIAIADAHEVLAEYGLATNESGKSGQDEGWRITTVEALQQETGFTPGEILQQELQGSVERLPGNRVRYLLQNVPVARR